MKLRPLYDQIMVKPVTNATVTDGGIQLIKADEIFQGDVIEVGHGRLNEVTGELDPLAVKAGDRVAYGKFSENKIDFEGEEYLMLREHQILGIILPEDE